MRPQSSGWPASALALGLLALSGCAMTPPDNQDLTELLDAYRDYSAQMEERRARFRERGIRELFVSGVGADVTGIRVTADLANASLAAVLDRIIEEASLSYSSGTLQLAERVSARFTSLPLQRALDQLLTPVGYQAAIRNGILFVKRSDPPLQDGEPMENLRAEVPLKYIDTEFAEDLLGSIYPDMEDVMTFAANPGRNSIFLSGFRAAVLDAEALLRQADNDFGHILIEVLVVEFNTEALRELSARIIDAARGSFSEINLDLGALFTEQISFTHVADTENVTQLTALLNLLIEDSQARIISRPYVATLSNESANLSVTDDRYVTVVSGDGDATLERVNSGVQLEVTPIVQWDGMIRLEIDLSESKFVPGPEGSNLRQTRNEVETTMRIGDGETIVVGGLMLNNFTGTDRGIPPFRETPFAGMLFGEKSQARQNRQVMMYLTPHLWTPGMDTPLLNQEAVPPPLPPQIQWQNTERSGFLSDE